MEVFDRIVREIVNAITQKSITVYFEDKEFEEIKKAKGDTSWHDFILEYSRKLKQAENIISKLNSDKRKLMKEINTKRS